MTHHGLIVIAHFLIFLGQKCNAPRNVVHLKKNNSKVRVKEYLFQKLNQIIEFQKVKVLKWRHQSLAGEWRTKGVKFN